MICFDPGDLACLLEDGSCYSAIRREFRWPRDSSSFWYRHGEMSVFSFKQEVLFIVSVTEFDFEGSSLAYVISSTRVGWVWVNITNSAYLEKV